MPRHGGAGKRHEAIGKRVGVPALGGGQLFDWHKVKGFLLMPDPCCLAYCLVPIALCLFGIDKNTKL